VEIVWCVRNGKEPSLEEWDISQEVEEAGNGTVDDQETHERPRKRLLMQGPGVWLLVFSRRSGRRHADLKKRKPSQLRRFLEAALAFSV
jgi:hypothetical protein